MYPGRAHIPSTGAGTLSLVMILEMRPHTAGALQLAVRGGDITAGIRQDAAQVLKVCICFSGPFYVMKRWRSLAGMSADAVWILPRRQENQLFPATGGTHQAYYKEDFLALPHRQVHVWTPQNWIITKMSYH